MFRPELKERSLLSLIRGNEKTSKAICASLGKVFCRYYLIVRKASGVKNKSRGSSSTANDKVEGYSDSGIPTTI